MLTEERRQQLDGIVTSMVANKENDATIRFVVDDFKKKYSTTQNVAMNSSTGTEKSNVLFPSSPTDTPLQAGAKAVGNLVPSTYNTVKGMASAVLNPIETGKGIRNIIAGATESSLNKIFNKDVQTEETEQFNAFTQMLKDRYGSLDALQKTATEDPFAFGADVLSVIEGGAGLAGKTAQLNKAIGTAGKLATTPVTKTAGKIADAAGNTAKFGISKATDLNPETITELLKNPQSFKNVNSELRMETATKVGDVLDERLDELSDMGKGYESIRQAPVSVDVNTNYLDNLIKSEGVKIENGRITPTTAGRIRDTRDINALQNLYNLWKPSFEGGKLTSNELLNFREDLSKLSKFGRDVGKSDTLEGWARNTRSDLNERYGAKVQGLRDLDAQYAPERTLLGNLKKDIFDAKGELKDGAISKIANITGKGKEQLLGRVKQIVPDIEERVRLIKAVEDIERASGFKVGTYTKGAALGGAVLTGNFVPAIVGAIVTNPAVAVPLLKGAGYAGQKAAPILNAIKQIANDVNNFRLPSQFKSETGDLKVGLSTQAVTPELVAKRVDGEDLKLIRDFVNKSDLDSYLKAQPVIEGAGIYGMDSQTMKRFLKEVVDLNTRKLTVKTTTPTYIKGTAGKFTGSVSQNLEPLVQEARKYKSAEEFVKAQGTPVYHGTNTKFDEFKMPSGNPGSEGVFVAPSKRNAEYYMRSDAGEVKELYLKKDAKIWDYKNPEDVKALQQKISEFIPENKNRQRWNKLNAEKDKIVERAIYKDNALTIRKGDLPRYRQLRNEIDNFGDLGGAEPKNLASKISSGWYTDISEALKNPEIKKWFEQNYDAWKQLDHTDYGTDISIGVFNPNSLKTKSQLTDIWKKANGKN